MGDSVLASGTGHDTYGLWVSDAIDIIHISSFLVGGERVICQLILLPDENGKFCERMKNVFELPMT